MNVQKAMALRTAPLQTPTDLKAEGVRKYPALSMFCLLTCSPST